MKTTDIQILRASIIERLFHIDNVQLLKNIEKQVTPSSPLAYTGDEVREILRERLKEDKSTYVAHKDVVEMSKRW